MALPAHGIRRGGSGSFSKFVAGLSDAMLLVFVVLLVPIIILLVGAPIVLIVRIIIEIAHRLETARNVTRRNSLRRCFPRSSTFLTVGARCGGLPSGASQTE